VNNELEKEQPWLNLRYYLGICLAEQKRTTKTLSQEWRCPDRRSNRTLRECKAEALSICSFFGEEIERKCKFRFL
jgi:hypothetical protein